VGREPRFDRFRSDPVGFAREVLAIEPWEAQERLIRAFALHDLVACRSGHKTGKSTAFACVALWFVSCFERARVIVTAPTHRQVKAIFWKEFKRLYNRARVPLGGNLHELPESGLQYPDGREVVGFFTKDAEKMAGYSGPAMLFLIDEASGVPDSIYMALEGNRAGGAKVGAFSNPTQLSGFFYDAFHKDLGWDLHHLSSVDAAERGPPGQGLATRGWCEEKLRTWGRTNPLYEVRVAGNFPKQGSHVVIPLALVEAAVARYEDTTADGELVLGVDVARFGDDDSVIAARRGRKVLGFYAVNGLDTVAVAAMVRNVADSLRMTPGEVVSVHVDVIGVGGGVADQLREDGNRGRIRLVEVNVAESSTQPDQFPDRRSELWFGIHSFLANGGAIPDDSILLGDLIAPAYSFDEKGRRKVESKKEIKKRLGRSPDRADALGLATFGEAGAEYSAVPISGRAAEDDQGGFKTRILRQYAEEYGYSSDFAEDDADEADHLA
jgi:hypothetical protein